MIVQGFGNVGSNAAQLMHEAGYKIIGIAEVGGGLHNKNGIDLKSSGGLPPEKWHRARLPRRGES